MINHPDRNAISTFSLPLCLFQNDLPCFLQQSSSNCHFASFSAQLAAFSSVSTKQNFDPVLRVFSCKSPVLTWRTYHIVFTAQFAGNRKYQMYSLIFFKRRRRDIIDMQPVSSMQRLFVLALVPVPDMVIQKPRKIPFEASCAASFSATFRIVGIG